MYRRRKRMKALLFQMKWPSQLNIIRISYCDILRDHIKYQTKTNSIWHQYYVILPEPRNETLVSDHVIATVGF